MRMRKIIHFFFAQVNGRYANASLSQTCNVGRLYNFSSEHIFAFVDYLSLIVGRQAPTPLTMRAQMSRVDALHIPPVFTWACIEAS